VQDLVSGSRPTTVAKELLFVGPTRWSSDGTRLYFTSAGDTAFAMYSVPRFGGTIEYIGPYIDLAVHPDGQTALATPNLAPHVLVLRTGTWEVLDTIRLPGELQPLGVDWAPNGRWALALGGGTTARLFLLDAGGRVVDQVDEPRLCCIGGVRAWPRVEWTPLSDGFYFLATAPGSRADLLRYGVDPRRGRFVGGGDTVLAQLQVPAFAAFDVSADGRLLTFSGGLTAHELWTIERPGPRRPWTTRRLLTSTTGISHADVSDVGRLIAYGAVEGSGDSVWQRLYVQPFEGGEPRPMGPRLRGVEGPKFPRGLGDTLFVRFRGNRDSVASALVPVQGGPMRSVPGDVADIIGLPDGRRLWFRSRADMRPTIEWHGQAGDRQRSISLSPDPFGDVAAPRRSADGRAVAFASFTVRDGRQTMRLYRLDTETGDFSLLHNLGFRAWGFVEWFADGRLAVDTFSSFFGGAENMRLRFYPSRGGGADVEELPLPFAVHQFDATPDLRRGVGIVESRRSDVFLVRNFDPRNRR